MSHRAVTVIVTPSLSNTDSPALPRVWVMTMAAQQASDMVQQAVDLMRLLLASEDDANESALQVSSSCVESAQIVGFHS